MAGVAGVEPTSAVLETVILPLNYTPKKVSNFIISQFFYSASFFNDIMLKEGIDLYVIIRHIYRYRNI